MQLPIDDKREWPVREDKMRKMTAELSPGELKGSSGGTGMEGRSAEAWGLESSMDRWMQKKREICWQRILFFCLVFLFFLLLKIYFLYAMYIDYVFPWPFPAPPHLPSHLDLHPFWLRILKCNAEGLKGWLREECSQYSVQIPAPT